MTHLQVGDTAPAIDAVDQHGNPVHLKDYVGKKVVLYFYPKDNTPGCTAEACNLRDNYDDLLQQGFVVLGVSTDSIQSHEKFIAKYNLPFSLVADPDKKVVEAYGVWGKKKFMGREYDGTHRVTFVIDEGGKIEKIFEKVKTKDHTHQILEAYRS